MRRLGGAGIRRGIRGPGAVSEAAWTPAQLSSLEAWYRADDVVLSGSSITTHTDKSGNARHLTQGTSTAQPTQVTRYGQSVGSYDGGDSMQGAFSATLAQPYEVALVFEETNLSAARLLFDGDDISNRAFCQIDATTGAITIRSGATFTSAKTITAATAHAAHLRFDGASSKVWLDDFRAAQESTGNAGTASLDGFTLGSSYTGGSAFWLGYIAEAVVVSANLSTADRALLGDYFTARYSGLTLTT